MNVLPMLRRPTALLASAGIAVVVALTAGTAAAAANTDGTDADREAAAQQAEASAAYDRALLLGRASGDPQLTARAAAYVTRELGDPGQERFEADVAGPPDRFAPTEVEPETDAADGSSDLQPGRRPGLLQPSADPSAAGTPAAAVTVPERRFDVVEGDEPSVEWYQPAAPGAAQGFTGSGRTVTGTPAGGAANVADGGFVCPVPEVTWFTNDWGFPRSGGRTHKGNDLFAPEGSPVVAVADATVTKVRRGDAGLGGRTVSYLTDDGDMLYNAHLYTVKSDLQVGERITAGQQVGTVGRTGNARTTPPHLHLGVYPSGGAAVSPYPYTSAACPGG